MKNLLLLLSPHVPTFHCISTLNTILVSSFVRYTHLYLASFSTISTHTYYTFMEEDTCFLINNIFNSVLQNEPTVSFESRQG